MGFFKDVINDCRGSERNASTLASELKTPNHSLDAPETSEFQQPLEAHSQENGFDARNGFTKEKNVFISPSQNLKYPNKQNIAPGNDSESPLEEKAKSNQEASQHVTPALGNEQASFRTINPDDIEESIPLPSIPSPPGEAESQLKVDQVSIIQETQILREIRDDQDSTRPAAQPSSKETSTVADRKINEQINHEHPADPVRDEQPTLVAQLYSDLNTSPDSSANQTLYDSGDSNVSPDTSKKTEDSPPIESRAEVIVRSPIEKLPEIQEQVSRNIPPVEPAPVKQIVETRTVSVPRVHIGQVDVIVHAPTEPKVAKNSTSSSNMESRLYLRRL